MVEQWNQLLQFLAVSDSTIENLTKEKQFDLLILAGNSLPLLTDVAGEVLTQGYAKKLLLTGGIGHATAYLRRNYRNNGYDFPEFLIEAEMNQHYLEKKFNISSECLLLETNSTNSGENARFSREVVRKELSCLPKRILLLNDPLLQRRTMATFELHWPNASLFSFSPYRPLLVEWERELRFSAEELNNCWSKDYFADLALGEIPRLRNDQDGYGPKGKQFIAEVVIPQMVEKAYSYLSQSYLYNSERKIEI